MNNATLINSDDPDVLVIRVREISTAATGEETIVERNVMSRNTTILPYLSSPHRVSSAQATRMRLQRQKDLSTVLLPKVSSVQKSAFIDAHQFDAGHFQSANATAQQSLAADMLSAQRGKREQQRAQREQRIAKAAVAENDRQAVLANFHLHYVNGDEWQSWAINRLKGVYKAICKMKSVPRGTTREELVDYIVAQQQNSVGSDSDQQDGSSEEGSDTNYNSYGEEEGEEEEED